MNVMKLEKNSQLRLENYRICKFIWSIANVPCTRHQIKYVCMFVFTPPPSPQHGLQGFTAKNIERESPEANDVSHIL